MPPKRIRDWDRIFGVRHGRSAWLCWWFWGTLRTSMNIYIYISYQAPIRVPSGFNQLQLQLFKVVQGSWCSQERSLVLLSRYFNDMSQVQIGLTGWDLVANLEKQRRLGEKLVVRLLTLGTRSNDSNGDAYRSMPWKLLPSSLFISVYLEWQNSPVNSVNSAPSLDDLAGHWQSRRDCHCCLTCTLSILSLAMHKGIQRQQAMPRRTWMS